MRSEAILQADPAQISTGNMSGIHPLSVYQKVRSEALAQSDRARNSISDLMQELEHEKLTQQSFIQKIDLHPFSTIIFNEENFKILQAVLRKGENVQLNIDATGGLLKKVSDRPLLHHTIILPIKSNMENSRHILFNIAEMITVDNCGFNIEYFLRLLKTKFLASTKEKRLAHAFITDKSFANIGAIIASQNNMSLSEYLSATFEICEESKPIGNLTLVLLCSSHLSKNWKLDINKFFGKLEKQQKFFLYSLIGNVMNIQDYEELKIYIKLLIRIFCCRTQDKEYFQIEGKLKKLISNGEKIHEAEDGDD